MKNILEIRKEYGLEVPEDKKKDFEKAVLENYKTVTDYDNQAKKLNAANDTIKANDTAMKDLQDKLDGVDSIYALIYIKVHIWIVCISKLSVFPSVGITMLLFEYRVNSGYEAEPLKFNTVSAPPIIL